MKRLWWLLGSVVLLGSFAMADEIGFVEDFALAKDRATSLRQLIPGTEDYYYYHALHYLNTEQYEKATALHKPWLERFGQTARLTEIQTRQALLTYERDPERTLAYLRSRLKLRFDHQKPAAGPAADLPTTLDQKHIARQTLRASALTQTANLDGFEESALVWLATETLTPERRRLLLQRLIRPDVPNLAKLIAEDLQTPYAAEFGTYPIHRQLTLVQLADLVGLRPELLNHTALVQAWLSKLHPGADEDWRHEPAAIRAYLERLQSFVGKLAPAHNGLQAHVLYHRLVFDRWQGIFDRGRFLEYLKLPRQRPYMAKLMLEAPESSRYPADLQAEYASFTLLPAVGDDEPLVRSYLRHFFIADTSPREFEPFINDVYLEHLIAETKIENGLGESEQWASQLPPEVFQQFRDRIDLDFAFTNKTSFAANEPVRLDLFVKNAGTLIVKIFEINALNYYRQHQREVDTDINLDGLTPNAEQTHNYAEGALRRVARQFEFPQLNRPGVYVIDFIANGKSSRALVRKGRLRSLVSTSTAGHSIMVIDDGNLPVKDATVWIGGQEFKANQDGRVIVPFSAEPGRRPVVLSMGEFACLDHMEHQAESYQLTAGIYVDREALLSQRVASLLVRPGLQLNGKLVSLKLLEDVKLRITSTDHDGIQSSTEVPDFKVFEDRESVHEFRAPARLASLSVTLRARVKHLGQNEKLDLEATEHFALNGIDKTDKIEDLHLAKFGPDYVFELRGRSGEPRGDHVVHLTLKHRDFKPAARATLKTDADGRLNLGPLADIVSVSASGSEFATRTWAIPTDRHTYRQLVHARTGETISLPYFGTLRVPTREEFALFEVEGDNIRADHLDSLLVSHGVVELRGLAAGDYDLWLKRSGERIRIRVVDGKLGLNGFAIGRLRCLELPELQPVQIAAIDADKEYVTVRLLGASPFTRVHVFGTRYVPAFSAFGNLSNVRAAELTGTYPAHAESVYLTGRNIGDEYRYVIDRKYQKKYPGNLLERPALLLNPWAVRSTETGEQAAKGGEDFTPKGDPAPTTPATNLRQNNPEGARPSAGDFANLDFLADASAVVVNLVPDKDGLVKVPRKLIGPHAMLHVVAVDPLNVTARSAAIGEQPAKFVDLRLHNGLDPKSHFTQQKQVSALNANQPFVLADAASSRFESYDSLARVYALFATLSKDSNLAEFAFILNWPKLKPEEKRALYSKHACHELSFFVAKKDPGFFKEVVQPYLASKKDKTFMDRWLLEQDLADYLRPWQFERLNTVERVLLAQRIPGEAVRTARHLNDMVRLQPPNTERTGLLFDTAIKGSVLSPEKGGFNAAGEFLYYREKAGQAGDGKVRGMPGGGMPAKGVTPIGDKTIMDSGMPKAASDTVRVITIEGLDSKAVNEAVQKILQREGRSAGKTTFITPVFEGGAVGQPVPQMDKATKEKLEELKARIKDGPVNVIDAFNPPEDQKEFFERSGIASARQFYRKLPPTQEWAENNYYHLPIQKQIADLVPVSTFWLDYARHDGKSPFLSRNLADASRNFTEMMLALAVLDLPFEAGKQEVKFDGGKMTLTPAGPAVAFYEEVRPAKPGPGQSSILVTQNFYRAGDRFRDENGDRLDKFVTTEFVIHTVYGCQLVITNQSSSKQRLSALIQVPEGAIPLGNAQYTKSIALELEPYRTQTIDYFFYFPKAGRFSQFPVHISKNEALVAFAAPFTFEVVERPTRPDTESWDYVAQHGSIDEVLAYLHRENVHALNLDKIAFRMRDRTFFDAVIKLLQERHAYHDTSWSYGLHHNAVAVAREYLLHSEQIVAQCGGPIVSPLLTVDPIARHTYEHLEYKPLVNARAHALGHKRQIVNPRLNEQYHRYLKQLSYSRELADGELLAVTYYLLLQDRVDEALATFGQVKPEKVATRVQYDYLAAYLDFFQDEPQRARAIAIRYTNYPVDHWKNAFTTMIQQLDEIGGKAPLLADASDRGQRQTQLAANEPGFEFTIDNKSVQLNWQNIDAVRVNYYLMDVELLFSRNPFVQQFGSQLGSIRPHATRMIRLNPAEKQMSLPMPAELARRNVLVEVVAAGKTRALPYYANAMDVRLMENYGHLRVTDAVQGTGLGKVYVKVYARHANGEVKFYKDGYTDLRGRFDYASVSTPEQNPITRFAILTLSEERGAVIREVDPPQQ